MVSVLVFRSSCLARDTWGPTIKKVMEGAGGADSQPEGFFSCPLALQDFFLGVKSPAHSLRCLFNFDLSGHLSGSVTVRHGRAHLCP